jgi:ornithine cyclodeaminase/alanine dehydrogenase-like protein (mu-crystallin family)
MTLILSNDDIDRLLTMPEYIDVLDDAYCELDQGRGVVRARTDSLAPTVDPEAVYALKSADGIAPKYRTSAVRINSDIVTCPVFDGQPRRVKVPAAPNDRWVGLVLLFSTDTGEPLAIFPDGVMQRMRVGATSGLGIKYMARENAETVGMIGSGWQAGAQLLAVTSVRDIKSVKIFSPSQANREAFCAEYSDKVEATLIPAVSAEEAMGDVDIAMCSTSSLDYIYFKEWLAPGLHFTSIKLPEVHPDAALAADRLVIHNTEDKQPILSAAGTPALEKVRGTHGSVKETIEFEKLPTLLDLVSGRVAGRENDSEITCFLNNTGTGYQFAACGAIAVAKAKELGIGNEVPTDWFTEDVHP